MTDESTTAFDIDEAINAARFYEREAQRHIDHELIVVSGIHDLPADGSWAMRADWDGMIVRRLDDRRWVGVMRLLFTHAVVWGYHSDGLMYEDRWCYTEASVAIAAATVWDGEGDPADGWIRQPFSGRRRPDGDPAQEYVEL